jgi:hypothetical protein
VIATGTAGWVGVYPGGTTTGNSSLNYAATGTSASGVAVKLNAGKATLVNHGGAAINVVLDAEGYFTTSSTDGAGYHPMTAVRLVDTGTATIAAGATYDVPVGGTHGLPTRGIAGALLNLTVANAAVGGYVTAWPVGDSEGSGSLTQFPAANARADAVSVRVGTDGKVRIRNRAAGAIRLLVDLQGWFSSAPTPLPAAPFSPMVGVQGNPAPGASAAPLQFAYVNNSGVLRLGYQADPSNVLTTTWTAVGDTRFTGPAAVGAQPDGGIQLAAQASDSDVRTAQRTVTATTFGPFTDQGGSMAAPPVMGTQPNGTLVALTADADGELWALPQTAANGAFGSWLPLGSPGGSGLTGGGLAVATVGTGVEIFAVDAAGSLRTAILSPGGTLSPWVTVGGTGLTGRPAVALYPGFQPRVFVRGGDGVVLTKLRNDDGTWPADFAPVGSLVAAGSPAAVFSPVTDRAEVVVRTSDGSIYETGETAQASGQWRDWVSELSDGDVAGSDPTTLIYNTGAGLVWGFMFQDTFNNGRLYSTRTTTFARKALPAAP